MGLNDKKYHLLGIINATTDSFSSDKKHFSISESIEKAIKLWEEGASIIDVGGESSRPGAKPIDPELEQKRVIPIIHLAVPSDDADSFVSTYHLPFATPIVDPPFT